MDVKRTKVILETFYKNIKNDETLLTGLSRLQKDSENTFLIKRVMNTVQLVANIIINQKFTFPRQKKMPDFFEKPQECKEIILLVRRSSDTLV